MEKISTQLTALNNNIETKQKTLFEINTNLTNLNEQVTELKKQNCEKGKKIYQMEIKISKIEQQLLANHIEINNVTNYDMSASEIVHAIAKKANVELSEHDILDAFKNKQNKMFVEFNSLRKKKELMSKTKHKIYASEININNKNNNFININDRLTSSSRRLLWLPKNKSKQNNWRFVWVRNGQILARKAENEMVIKIESESDIENIN